MNGPILTMSGKTPVLLPNDACGERLLWSLPFDLLVDIFLRLPVETLLTARGVCKSWCSFISSDEFVRFHLSRSSSNPYNLVQMRRGEYNVDGLIFYFRNDREAPHFVSLGRLTAPVLVSSCDGLLLLKENSQQYFHVINPTTRMIMTLPEPPFKRSALGRLTQLVFDQASQAYKVVVIIYAEDYVVRKGELVCYVFTLGVDCSWRKKSSGNTVVNVKPMEEDNSRCLHFPIVNNAIHWIEIIPAGADPNIFSSVNIMAFEVGDEQFRMIASPNCFPFNFGCTSCISLAFHFHVLAEHQGSLRLLYIDYCKQKLEVWLLKDYERGLWIREPCICSEVLSPMPPRSMPTANHVATINGAEIRVQVIRRSQTYPSSSIFREVLSYNPQLGRLKRYGTELQSSGDLSTRGVFVKSLVKWSNQP